MQRDSKGRFIKGHKVSEKNRLHLRLLKLGKKLSEEHKKKISEHHRHYQSEKTKIKISHSLKGKPKSINHRENISKTNLGKHYSPETEFKKGMKSVRLGTKHKPESIEKMRRAHKKTYKKGFIVWNKGVPWSKESKEKMSRTRIRMEYSKGENHPSFNNWSSLLPYDKNFNDNFKNQVRKRDNQVCMNCGKHKDQLRQTLHVHHINYNKELTLYENCISLCVTCHMLTNYNREYWTKLFQKKLSKLYNYKYSKENKIILRI